MVFARFCEVKNYPRRFHGIMSEAMNLGSLINGISSFLHVTAVHAESKEVALSGWSKGD